MTAPVRIGEVLAGKYRVDCVLGVGAMGVVVAAHHIELNDRVAIKFVRAETLDNADAVARFAREARAAVKIKSEHVARVSDVGRLDNGAPYMVMEYLEGVDLSSWIKQSTLSVEQAVEFILQACEALAEAHSLGIVHRDLKPANLFVIRRPDGTLSVKVLDFGISKMAEFSASHPDMTSTSAIMGSPAYMSPEQLRSSKDVDARSDIWALGIVLYELLTGKSAFRADTMPDLMLQITSGPSPDLHEERPDAPEGLDEVIHRCLEKDRSKRFQTIGHLANALAEFASKRARASIERISGVMHAAGLSDSAMALPSSSTPGKESAPEQTGSTWGTTWARPARAKAAIGLGAMLVFAGGAALTVARSPSSPKAEESSTHAPDGPGFASARIEPSASIVWATAKPAETPPPPLEAPSSLAPADRRSPATPAAPAIRVSLKHPMPVASMHTARAGVSPPVPSQSAPPRAKNVDELIDDRR